MPLHLIFQMPKSPLKLAVLPCSREQLLSELGNVILAKPVLSDLKNLREGGVLWGWPHCTQQSSLTQVAIERKQTLIAFEEMFVWSPTGIMGRHTFYKNNGRVRKTNTLFHSPKLITYRPPIKKPKKAPLGNTLFRNIRAKTSHLSFNKTNFY